MLLAFNLQELQILGCNNLEAIPEWICKLKSLRNLEIWACCNLQSLPHGLSSLTSLEEIGCCPTLLEKSQR